MTEQSHAIVRRLEEVDGFLVTDLPGADSADGVVRCAKKVLVDSTKALARSRSYSWALLEQRISGASGAVNATGDSVEGSLGSFAAELAADVASGALTLAAGKGVPDGALDGLGSVVQPDPESLASGIVACISAALEGAPGDVKVAVEHDGGAGEQLVAQLESAGASVTATGSDAWDAPAEVLLFGSKAGVLDHQRAADLPQQLLVPTAPLAFTPRALAVANRAGKVILADFLTTAGPLATRAGLDPAQRLGELTRSTLASDQGAVLGACTLAEAYLSQWCDELPFGRPIG
ncbi:MAG: hypothetical protein R2714_00620 [Microthrixaceae bacterium]